MTKNDITQNQIFDLAKRIKHARKLRNETLISVQKNTGINCGQLSRFESGSFKKLSKNLQKVCVYLQISPYQYISAPSIGSRLDNFAKKSPHHMRIAEDLVVLLEEIMINQ